MVFEAYCLAQYAEEAPDKAKEWLSLSKAAAIEDAGDMAVVRLIVDEANLLSDPTPDEARRKTLEGRLKRLEAFQAFSSTVTLELRQRLGNFQSASGSVTKESDTSTPPK